MVLVRWLSHFIRFMCPGTLRSEPQAARDFMCQSMLGPEWLPPR